MDLLATFALENSEPSSWERTCLWKSVVAVGRDNIPCCGDGGLFLIVPVSVSEAPSPLQDTCPLQPAGSIESAQAACQV